MEISHDLIHKLTLLLSPDDAKKILDDFNRKYEPSLPTKMLIAKLVEIGRQDD